MKIASLLLASFAVAALTMIATATSSSAGSKYEQCMSRCGMAYQDCHRKCVKL